MNDILYMGSSQYLIVEFKLPTISQPDMADLGVLYDFINLEVDQDDHGAFLSQMKYMLDILQKFNLLIFKTISTHLNTITKL